MKKYYFIFILLFSKFSSAFEVPPTIQVYSIPLESSFSFSSVAYRPYNYTANSQITSFDLSKKRKKTPQAQEVWFKEASTVEPSDLTIPRREDKSFSSPLDWDYLTELDRAHKKISVIPESIQRTRGLTRLFLQDNIISILPEEIGQLSALQVLNLNNNKLESLPSTITQLSQLKQLYLDNNSLTSLPEEFHKLRTLTILCLEKNKLKELPPNFGLLPCLQELNLGNNPLYYLPTSIIWLVKLTKLNLSRVGNTLKSSIVVFPLYLQELDITDNQWKELPRGLDKLRNLKILKNEGNAPQFQAGIDRLFNLQSAGLTFVFPSIEMVKQKTSLAVKVTLPSFANLEETLNPIEELPCPDWYRERLK